MNENVQKMIDRHAIRHFQDRQLEEDILEQILTAGLYAPTAGNNQRSKIVVCQDKEINEKLGRLSRYMFFKDREPSSVSHSVSADQPSIQDDYTIMDGFYGAPTVLTIFAPPMIYSHDDAAFIASNIWHAANFLDIGCCYIGRADEVFATEYGMELRKRWDIPENFVAVANMLLGYPDGPAPKAKPRKEGRIIRV